MPTVKTKAVQAREVISQKEAKLRIIRAGVAGDASVKKLLGKLTDKNGESFSAVRTTKKIITDSEVIEVQTSVSVRRSQDLPATSLDDAIARQKSYKANVKDANGNKQHVFLSWIRKDRETGELLETPIPMVNVNGTGREPFAPKHEIQFNLNS